MKVITLNTWCGILKEDLEKFIIKYNDVDIFLFQEVYHNATPKSKRWQQNIDDNQLSNIQRVLSDHDNYYAPTVYGEWGSAIFIKKKIEVKEFGEVMIYGQKDNVVDNDGKTIGKNLQYIKTEDYTFINIHGLWNGQGKNDSDDRINQSRKIIDFAKNISGKVIIGGDFNLKPDTESLTMIEKELNLKNLIKDYSVTDTRTSHYTKDERYADYFLISPNIQILDFKVLPEEASDHAALYLEI